jgi:hypothetical protein
VAGKMNASPSDQLVSINPGSASLQQNNVAYQTKNNSGDRASSSNDHGATSDSATHPATYDTVSSVHDIEQDDHVSYYIDNNGKYGKEPLIAGFSKLTKILEVPSKNITRNNSVNDVNEIANSKF